MQVTFFSPRLPHPLYPFQHYHHRLAVPTPLSLPVFLAAVSPRYLSHVFRWSGSSFVLIFTVALCFNLVELPRTQATATAPGLRLPNSNRPESIWLEDLSLDQHIATQTQHRLPLSVIVDPHPPSATNITSTHHALLSKPYKGEQRRAGLLHPAACLPGHDLIPRTESHTGHPM